MKLLVHMKSGKTLTMRNVVDYKFEVRTGEISSIEVEIEQGKRAGVRVQSIMLSQIEAIEEEE